MKRLKRDPMTFELLEAFSIHGREEKVSLRNDQALDSFFAKARQSITNSMENPARLHGLRTQAMFASLVASLGEVQLLKYEDAGEVYTQDENLEIPDFRIVLSDGSQVLVEAKNFFQTGDGTQGYTFNKNYVDGLLTYGQLTSCNVKVAIYWVRWNVWTLVPLKQITLQHMGDKYSLALTEAMMLNEMALLGDRFIGTRWPLRCRFLAKKGSTERLEGVGRVGFTIDGVQLFCQDNIIEDELERGIAWYLMLFGGWGSASDAGEAKFDGDELLHIEYSIGPMIPPDAPKQEFAFVDSLSGMFSRYYLGATEDGGLISKIRANFEPGQLGQLIPDKYQSTSLPLWRFHIRADQGKPSPPQVP